MKHIVLSLIIAAIGAGTGSTASAQTASANIAYDEVTPAYGSTVGDAHDFETRYARISDAIKSGDYMSESALATRLSHLSEERMRDSQLRDKAGMLGGLLSMLPGPAGQIVSLASNHSPGAFLGLLAHAIPGVGGMVASELIAHLPSKAAHAVNALGDGGLSKQLLRASEFERTVGTLKHYTFYNGMERIDDVAGQTAQIIQPQQNRTIELDMVEKRYSIQAMGSDMLSQLAARSAGGTYTLTGTEAVAPLPATTIAGTNVTGYTIDRNIQIAVTGQCGTNTSEHVVTTAYFASFPSPHGASTYMDELSQKCTKDDRMTHQGPAAPSDRLAVFQRIAFPDKHVEIVMERGNVREATAADAPLFEIPAGYRPW